MNPDTTEMPGLLAEAKELQRAGRLEDAAAAYRRVLVLEPDHPEALNNLGNALRALKRPAEALDCLERALAARPGHPAILSNLGLALADLRRFDAAADCYRKAIGIDPAQAVAHNNLALALKELGRNDEAEASCRRALEIRPDFPEAHNNLGNILCALDRQKEAAAAYRRAIELRPRYAEAHYNLANALRDCGDLDAAEAAYRAALALAPALAEARTNLGNMLREMRRLPEALEQLARVADSRPEDDEARSNLINTLRDAGRLDDAEEALRAAIAAKPGLASAWRDLGEVLRDKGLMEDALAGFREALRLEPDSARAWHALGTAQLELGELAEAERSFGEAIGIDPAFVEARLARLALDAVDPSLDEVKQAEALGRNRKSATPGVRSGFHFGLGRAYERLKLYDPAFENFAEGARLRRSIMPYDEAAALDSFGRIARVFSPDLVRTVSGGGCGSELPIFVVGFPRSGTTLTEQILASHPDIRGAGELTLLSDEFFRFTDGGLAPPQGADDSARRLSSELRQLGEAYVHKVAAHKAGARHVTDKMPENYRLLGLIHLALPRARIICVSRDPVDTCVSCFTTNFAKGHPYTYDLGELGRYYRRYLELMAHWRRVLPAGAMLELRYEEVIGDIEGQARRMLAYCGLPWDDRCLAFDKTRRPIRTASVLQVRRPLYRTSMGRWRRYERHLGPLLEALGPVPADYRADTDRGTASAANHD